MKVLAIIAGIGLVGYVAYQFLFPTYTHRYRLTIEVEVDGKVRSASSVIEVRIQDQNIIGLPHVNYVPSVSGEAVFLELGKSRHVIAVLGFGRTGREHPPDVSTLARDAINPLPRDRGLNSLKLMSKLPPGRKTKLVGRQIPTMVTFSDLTNPDTAQVVPIDDFSRVIGADVRFHAAWVEITRDAVTRGISEKLPAIVSQLEERNKKSLYLKPTDPFIPSLGKFRIE